jgi:hypothetical protein
MKAEGIPVHMLSNDVQEWSRNGRGLHSLDDYFAGFVISGELKAYKPNPAIYPTLLADSIVAPMSVYSWMTGPPTLRRDSRRVSHQFYSLPLKIWKPDLKAWKGLSNSREWFSIPEHARSLQAGHHFDLRTRARLRWFHQMTSKALRQQTSATRLGTVVHRDLAPALSRLTPP